MNRLRPTALMLVLAGCMALSFTPVATSAEKAAEKAPEGKQPSAQPANGSRIFELRIYTANDGKLEALHARFRDHTNALFRKHGMEVIGYWVPTDERRVNTLVYILAYPSKEAREAAWKAFESDPEWIKAKDDSQRDGKLVKKVDSSFMTPTDYSPIK